MIQYIFDLGSYERFWRQIADRHSLFLTSSVMFIRETACLVYRMCNVLRTVRTGQGHSSVPKSHPEVPIWGNQLIVIVERKTKTKTGIHEKTQPLFMCYIITF
jgi:hypothetical protein